MAWLVFLLCLPVWVSVPPSLLGLTSQAPFLCHPPAMGPGQCRQAHPSRSGLSESPARYSNKELKGMLVWSPNHCVSDAKREWGGTSAPSHLWELGAWRGVGEGVCAIWWPALLRSGLEAEVCGFSPCPGARAQGASPLSGLVQVRSCNPFSVAGPLPPPQLTSTLPWPRRSTATTSSR